jgi:transcriptional regulator with GAF, ATPase, and Fis domain
VAASGTVLLAEGQATEELIAVVTGKVEISRTVGKDPVFIAERGPYSLHGESALLADRKAGATVTALVETGHCRIPATAFRRAMLRNPVLTERLLGDALTRLTEREDRYFAKVEDRLRDNERRLARYEEAEAAAGTMPRGVWGAEVADAVKQARSVADSGLTVLVLGEPGTGKQFLVEFIHQLSTRSNRQLHSINCAALVETLAESELFGHVKGAFTGAYRDQEGLFRVAHQGTLFLDEVGELPLGLQAKLLRVLQERRARPVGGNAEYDCDVRLLCATNRDLLQEVREKRFREDLYYRLYGSKILLPPLRKRRSDLPALAEYFVKKAAPSACPSYVLKFVIRLLLGYPWPGNIRELGQTIEEALWLAREHWHDQDFLLPGDFRSELRAATQEWSDPASSPTPPGVGNPGLTVDEVLGGLGLRDYQRQQEIRIIQQAVDESHGVMKDAALRLGFKPQALANIRRHHRDPKR